MKVLINNICIRAISSYLPEENFEMSSLANSYGEKEVVSIIRAIGVERVRIAKCGETSSDMCYKAAEYLLHKEGINREEIDGLVFVSQTTDYILPATSIILQDRLNLSKETVCLDIHYGCSGFIYGLYQAALWINSGSCKNVLILAGDTTSRMIHPLDRSLKMVFGDAGTATLVSTGTKQMGVSICSDGSGYDRLIVPAGGFRIPVSGLTNKIEFDVDNNGRTLENLYMDGMAIFNFAISNVHKNIQGLLDYIDWGKSEIDMFALHQANRFIINYIRKKLKVDESKVPINVQNFGNTGPATIPLLFSDLAPEAENVQRVIMSGFGVGLSWGSIAIEMSDTHFYKPINV